VTTETFLQKKSEKRGETEKLKIKRINEWEVSLLPFIQLRLSLCLSKMNTMKNISLYLPQINGSITKNNLRYLLKDICHLGEIENIEMIEHLYITPENTCSAFVYFKYWFPTLGNALLQEKLETGTVSIPYAFQIKDATENGELIVYKNKYNVTPSISSDEEEELQERELMEFIDNQEEEIYYQEMEDAIELMGNESFEFVSSDYASRLETELFLMNRSKTPVPHEQT
jgi:hypothetical protein